MQSVNMLRLNLREISAQALELLEAKNEEATILHAEAAALYTQAKDCELEADRANLLNVKLNNLLEN